MRTRKITALLVLVMVLALGLAGCDDYPKYSLTGQVISSVDSRPIQGVKVTASGKSTTTNKDGVYRLTGLEMQVNSVMVIFEKEGFATATELYIFPTVTSEYKLDVGLANKF